MLPDPIATLDISSVLEPDPTDHTDLPDSSANRGLRRAMRQQMRQTAQQLGVPLYDPRHRYITKHWPGVSLSMFQLPQIISGEVERADNDETNTAVIIPVEAKKPEGKKAPVGKADVAPLKKLGV